MQETCDIDSKYRMCRIQVSSRRPEIREFSSHFQHSLVLNLASHSQPSQQSEIETVKNKINIAATAPWDANTRRAWFTPVRTHSTQRPLTCTGAHAHGASGVNSAWDWLWVRAPRLLKEPPWNFFSIFVRGSSGKVMHAE